MITMRTPTTAQESVNKDMGSELALSCHSAVNDTLITSKNIYNF